MNFYEIVEGKEEAKIKSTEEIDEQYERKYQYF